jgi:hypothetical protein
MVRSVVRVEVVEADGTVRRELRLVAPPAWLFESGGQARRRTVIETTGEVVS